MRKPQVEESIRLEGERRTFADDESRKVYEESIKMAEGADLEFKPDEHYRSPRIFKGRKIRRRRNQHLRRRNQRWFEFG